MTDKQIIIDGVDVSGCGAYSKHREGYCGWYTPCEGDSCSYKLEWALNQLKRKEQECEELEEQLELNTANAVVIDMAQRLYKLKQILAEIKEIAERDKQFCDKCDGDIEIDCVDCHEGGRALLAKEILQKISECEVE